VTALDYLTAWLVIVVICGILGTIGCLIEKITLPKEEPDESS
jgi:hypothetical protein